jgi:hypothetical protein
MSTSGSSLLRLCRDHLADLQQSGLNEKTIATWGAYSIEEDQKSVLVQMGFGHLEPPALALPVLPPDRDTPNLNDVVVKPDRPRLDGRGRKAKYEARPKSRNRIHAPLSIRDKLAEVSEPLVITEGQKKAEKAAQEGICAIALAGVWNWKDRIGETSFPSPDFELFPLDRRRVFLSFDSDAVSNSNVRHAERDLAAYLKKRFLAQVSIKRLPPGQNGSKVGLDDFLLIHTVEQFWQLPAQEPDSLGRTIEPPIERYREEWPQQMADEAFHGLIGDFVRLISPQTESDPIALLMQFVIFFGNAIGRTSYYQVEADRHTTNINAILVGDTASGRKGTSLSQTRRPFDTADQVWAETRIQSGLSSGEGLIWAVRDPIERKDPIKQHGRVVGYEAVVADHGVEDKRLLVIETEFSSTLKVADRDGNTLTGVIRQAWDTGTLRLMTKSSPAKSTGAHISIIGHIPQNELLRYMSTTELGNGFANRFLWLCVKRSKMLPDGGHIPSRDLGTIIGRLRDAIEFGKRAGEATRDSAAHDAWHAVYEELSSRKPGLLGAILSRAEAQVTRLSLIYALLDCSTIIRLEHLDAAIAVWEYAEASVRYVFGDAIGDPVSDQILAALRSSPGGLTRAEISDLFSRNRDRQSIDHALSTLRRQDLANPVRQESGGRPVERWIAIRLKCGG